MTEEELHSGEEKYSIFRKDGVIKKDIKNRICFVELHIFNIYPSFSVNLWNLFFKQ